VSGEREAETPELATFEPLDAPTPGDLPPDTTPVDPEVLDTVEEGLDGGSPGRKHVVVIGAGLAGLVAAF
jgi:NADPH-dependent 2,4-dienoyl-CoA reductase/sulfur reductase-like enzyme